MSEDDYEPIQVRRVIDDRGSHRRSRVEPPLDQHWSPLEKLRWHAAVLEADTGIRIHVYPARFFIRDVKQVGYYELRSTSWSLAAMSYEGTWEFLNGVAHGYREAKQ